MANAKPPAAAQTGASSTERGTSHGLVETYGAASTPRSASTAQPTPSSSAPGGVRGPIAGSSMLRSPRSALASRAAASPPSTVSS